MGKKPIKLDGADRVLIDHWKDQCRADQEKWHEAKGSFKNDEQRTAWRAGFDNGWMLLIQTMKVQGYVTT